MRTCPRCTSVNLEDNLFCVKCGTSVAGDSPAPTTVAVPRSMIVIAAGEVAVGAVMLAIVLFFMITVIALMGGGPFGGGGVKVHGVSVTEPGSWLEVQSPDCGPCEASTGGEIGLSMTLKNTDSMPHTITGIQVSPSDFKFKSSSSDLPKSLQPGESFTLSAKFTAPDNSWEGELKVTVEGS